MDLVGLARLLIGAIVLGWLPGYAWVRLLAPRLSRVEKGVLSIALSVALLSLGLYLMAVFGGVPIQAPTAMWLALSLTLAALSPGLADRLERRAERAITAGRSRVVPSSAPPRE